GFGELEVDVEAYSEFESTYMATEVLSRLNVPFDRDPIKQWLLANLNPDGGFGSANTSNITSTFHAVASLYNLGYPVRQLSRTVNFLRLCEKPRGGFTAVPKATLPYIDDTYAGVTALTLLGESCAYPEATASFVLNLQNSNGGFRRSIALGISTFESTYYALSILHRLGFI
ncbi:MAG: prenyltransferase/squalene oxidase repeat-containing protein, partial [Candidatus Bathyarchaeia archaeon]